MFEDIDQKKQANLTTQTPNEIAGLGHTDMTHVNAESTAIFDLSEIGIETDHPRIAPLGKGHRQQTGAAAHVDDQRIAISRQVALECLQAASRQRQDVLALGRHPAVVVGGITHCSTLKRSLS